MERERRRKIIIKRIMNIEGKPPSHGNMTRGPFYNLGFIYD